MKYTIILISLISFPLLSQFQHEFSVEGNVMNSFEYGDIPLYSIWNESQKELVLLRTDNSVFYTQTFHANNNREVLSATAIENPKSETEGIWYEVDYMLNAQRKYCILTQNLDTLVNIDFPGNKYWLRLNWSSKAFYYSPTYRGSLTYVFDWPVGSSKDTISDFEVIQVIESGDDILFGGLSRPGYKIQIVKENLEAIQTYEEMYWYKSGLHFSQNIFDTDLGYEAVYIYEDHTDYLTKVTDDDGKTEIFDGYSIQFDENNFCPRFIDRYRGTIYIRWPNQLDDLKRFKESVFKPQVGHDVLLDSKSDFFVYPKPINNRWTGITYYHDDQGDFRISRDLFLDKSKDHLFNSVDLERGNLFTSYSTEVGDEFINVIRDTLNRDMLIFESKERLTPDYYSHFQTDSLHMSLYNQSVDSTHFYYLKKNFTSTVDLQKESPAIFPNPTTGVLKIPDVRNGNYKMYSQSLDLIQGGIIEEGIIDISGLISGVYFLEIIVESKMHRQVVIKK